MKKYDSFSFCLSFCLLLALTNHLAAQIRLPRLISDGMMLQRETKLKIWGWASPQEEVALIFDRKTYRDRADADGHWEIILPPHPAGGPFEMMVKGKNEVTIRDILFGDVWVCSGQSNMELTMERVKDKYPSIIANSKNTNIRQFLVPDAYDFKHPQEDYESGRWESANPNNLLSFSAVAYFFAKEISETQHVPIGLINASLGGSPIEAWMSEKALVNFQNLFAEYLKFKDDQHIKEIETDDKNRISLWYRKLNSQDPGILKAPSSWVDPKTNDSDWLDMTIPGYWSDGSLKNINGSVWFRRKFNVAASMIGKQTKVWLGRIVDQDSVFINGKFIGTTGYQYPPRKYEVGPDILNEGENTIVIRVINNSGRGGFVPGKAYFVAAGSDTIDLKGVWKYKLGAAMPPLDGATAIRWKPVGLFNKMISPMLLYSVKGILWYQGESNTGQPESYRRLFPAMILDWREKWKRDIPFLYVQLANFMEPKALPMESNWAIVRDAQRRTLSLPKTGMAVAIDLGEWNDVHPLNKEEVGRRLALAARRIAYENKKLVYAGPVYQSMKIAGNKIRITFSNTGSGLIAKGGGLKYFSIAGPDKEFHWAMAQIEGNDVIVWSDDVIHPVAVRYAWADNPEGANLYNKEGLPASPFTTE